MNNGFGYFWSSFGFSSAIPLAYTGSIVPGQRDCSIVGEHLSYDYSVVVFSFLDLQKIKKACRSTSVALTDKPFLTT